MNSRILLFTVLFALALLVIVILANGGWLPDTLTLIYSVPFGDKVSHFILTGLLSLLVNLTLSARKYRLASRDFLLGSLLVSAVVTVEELIQVLFPTRNASIIDLASSYLGIWLFGRLADRLLIRTHTT